MEMTETSELAALRIIITDASTGNAAATVPPGRIAARASAGPATRPSPRKTMTGMPTVPETPIGSRTKILISSHVSRSRFTWPSLANRPASQSQEHILEGRQLGTKVRDPDPVLRDARDDVRDQIAPPAPDRDLPVVHDD